MRSKNKSSIETIGNDQQRPTNSRDSRRPCSGNEFLRQLPRWLASNASNEGGVKLE